MSFEYNGIEFPTEEEMVEYIREVEGADANVGYIREITEKEYKGSFVDKFDKIEKMVDTAEKEDRRLAREEARLEREAAKQEKEAAKLRLAQEREGKYIIFTLSCGSRLYLSKSNRYTFNASEALVTDFETARKRAFFMSKCGHNEWYYQKLK